MDNAREELYRKLEGRIGKTPLYEIKNIDIPNGNRIFAKEEYLNPTGSHYDRVFLKLLYALEKEGKICPCQELVETTSGNAGAAFAWLCAALQYKATVVIPEDMPKARVAHIKSFGAKVLFSPKGEYISGTIRYLRQYLSERKLAGHPIYCTNHAESYHSIEGMREAGREIVETISSEGTKEIDFYVSALGGGITVRGLVDVLSERNSRLQIIGVEPFEAPDNYVRRYPGRFESEYGYRPRMSPHELLGIGQWGDSSYKFPHMEKMLDRLDDIRLSKKNDWSPMWLELRDKEAKHVGRTSAACLWTAREIAKEVREKVFVILFYDPAWKYLDVD